MSPKSALRGFIAFGIILALVLVLKFDLARYLSLDTLQTQREALHQLQAARPGLVASSFFLLYVAVAALSVPGAAILTLAAGAIFGVAQGVLLVSFASALGATGAFLSARYLLRDFVQRTFSERIRAIDAGLARDGPLYLLTLRLIPAVPFFVINVALGVTQLPTRVFYWVSQLGMLPATVVFVNAGTRLAQIKTLSNVLAPEIWLSLAVLGLFPWLARAALTAWRTHQRRHRFRKPRRFETNLVVIGAGSSGLVAAYIAAAIRAKVILIERAQMGGDCLNTGCVPSKTLIRAAKHVHQTQHATRYGLPSHTTPVDFPALLRHVRAIIARIEPHDSPARYAALGVECVSGEAQIVTPYHVRVGQRDITTRSIIIAAGARPCVPDLPGLADIPYVTSDTVWALQALPPRLVVLGGGPIGCELGQAFARLGSKVTIVQHAPRVLMKEDPAVGDFIAERLRSEGLCVLTGYRALSARRTATGGVLCCEAGGADGEVREHEIEFDCLLLAVGRVPNVTGLGLEALGIAVSAEGALETDRYLQVLYPNLYACGDIVGPYQFTHAAAHQAWYASVNALFAPYKRFAVDYRVLPWCTFTDPEVARVGLNVTEATNAGVAYEVQVFPIAELDRALTDGAAYGSVTVLTRPGSDRILGATIVAERAGDIIAELALAMRHGIGLNKVLGTVHSYPTWMEANKSVAGAWRRAHQPAALLKLLGRYHRWRRGA